MNNQNENQIAYKCPKCGNRDYELGEIRTTGGFLTQFFNIQNQHFTSVTCTNCKYTEFYKKLASKGQSIIDFLGNG